MCPTEPLKAKSSSVIPEPKLFLSLLQFRNMVIPLQTASSGVEGLFCIAPSQRTFFSGKNRPSAYLPHSYLLSANWNTKENISSPQNPTRKQYQKDHQNKTKNSPNIMEIKQHNPKHIASMRKSQGRFQNKNYGENDNISKYIWCWQNSTMDLSERL